MLNGCSPLAQRVRNGHSKSLSIDKGLPILKEVFCFAGNLPAEIIPNTFMLPSHGSSAEFPFSGVGIASHTGVLTFYTTNKLRELYRNESVLEEVLNTCKKQTHRCPVSDVCLVTLGEEDETTYDHVYANVGFVEQRFIPGSELEQR